MGVIPSWASQPTMCVPGRVAGASRMQAGWGRLADMMMVKKRGEAEEELAGEPRSVLLVRPVPPRRASLAELLLTAHPVPVAGGQQSGFGLPGVTVWELCDPAAGDEPPWAVVATRPREPGPAVEVVSAAVVPGGSSTELLRRLFTDVAAVLRPAGYPMLMASVPRAQAEAIHLLVAAGFAAQPGLAGRSSRLVQYSDRAPGAAHLGPEAPPGLHEPGQRDHMWFTLEL